MTKKLEKELTDAIVTTAAEAEPVDDRCTMYDYLGVRLKALQEDTKIGHYLQGDLIVPAKVVDDIQHMLYRIPRADRTVTRPFDQTDRQLLRAALTARSEALVKEAKRMVDMGYQGMADRLTADANALTSRLLPEFFEQRELPMAPATEPQAELEIPEGAAPALVPAGVDA